MLALTLDPYVRDWADLLIRWLHVIAAIGWIGSSFYFVLLDQSLRKPKDEQDVEDGVGGELWEVHGGGFYHVKKYKVAPPSLPDHLAWFKWEAYATWISGFALLVVLYWFDARTYMIDPTVADLSELAAVGISAGLLVVAWAYYDIANRLLHKREALLSIVIVIGIALAAWGTQQLYNPRAAWLQVGAMIGTVMAGSVFFNIIPAHWELIRAKEAGRDPDPTPGIIAKQRSVHNNYFTLPVLITMLAGHFAFLTGRDSSWLILLSLMAIGAFVRHFYNLRHGGTNHWWMPAAAVIAIVFLFVALWPDDEPTTASTSGSSSTSTTVAGDGQQLFSGNCASCHALAAADAAGGVGPSLDATSLGASDIADRIENGKGGMPAFRGRLDEDEIDAIAEYVAESAQQ